MRIVHITVKPNCVRTQRAARAHKAAGHEVLLLMGGTISQEKSVLIETKSIGDCPVFNWNQKHGAVMQAAIISLKPDMLYAHELEALFLVTAKWGPRTKENLLDGVPAYAAGYEYESLPFPVVYDCHEYELGRPFLWKTPSVDRLRSWQERSSIVHADHVVAPSPSIAARLKDQYALRDTPSVVVNSPPCPRRALARKQMREQMEISENEKAIGFAGHISSDRMLAQLASAFSVLGRGWKLCIFGAGGVEPDLVELLEGVGANMMGHVPYPWPERYDDGLVLLDYLSAMDVAFCGADLEWPSWKMSAPNKFFEYAFAGVPMVASEAIDTANWIHRYGLGVTYNNSVNDLVAKLQLAALKPVAREDRTRVIGDFAYENEPTRALMMAGEIAQIRHLERSGGLTIEVANDLVRAMRAPKAA